MDADMRRENIHYVIYSSLSNQNSQPCSSFPCTHVTYFLYICFVSVDQSQMIVVVVVIVIIVEQTFANLNFVRIIIVVKTHDFR